MTAPRERPILFSGPMVRAILEGHKTQTRRVVRWPFSGQPNADEMDNAGDCVTIIARGKFVKCPFGEVGDRLWVRETFATYSGDGGTSGLLYRADPMFDTTTVFDWTWKPSIHMPRWASRLSLEITQVRVERIQDITEEDAQAEGRTLQDFGSGGPGYFPHTWDALNAKRGFSWEANPWVWVIGFGVVP